MGAFPGPSAGALLLLAALGQIPPLSAATFVWDGGHPAQERLSDNQNWNPNGAPPNDGTADLVFTGAVRLNPIVDTAWSVNSITFNYLAGAFNLNGGFSLMIQGNAVAAAIANVDADTQTISAPLITGASQTWSANAGSLLISGAVANNYALTVAGVAHTTISGAISGSGSLTKTGAGTLILSGANTYSGGTTVSSGILKGSTSSLQGNISTASGSSLVFDQSSNGTFSGVLSGSGSLTKSGSGVVTLSGSNTFSGGAIISAGTLRLSGGSALSDTGAVVLADVSGATLDLAGSSETIGSLSGGGSNGGNVTLGSGGALSVGSSNTSTTFSGVISGSGSLTKTGSGSLTLTGSNSYSGGTTVSAGTLQGSTASLQGNISTASGSSLVFDQSSSGTFSGVLSGSGSLTKSGSGVVTLSGSNTFSGSTTVSGGGLALGANNALSASSALALASGTTLSLGGAYSARVASLGYADATLDFGTSGTANAFLFGSAGSASGTLTVLNWTSGSDTFAFASGASVADEFIENIYFSGVGSGVRGATGVSVSGYTGTWDTIVASSATFDTWNGAGANDNLGANANWSDGSAPVSGATTKIAFSGSTRVTPNLTSDLTLNSLKFDSGAGASFTLATNSGKTLTFAGSVPSLIQASGSAQTVAVPVALTKNTFVEIGGAGNLVLSGVVSGTGGFTVLGSGAGEVVLSGANTYSGNTAINAGTVVLQNSAALGDVSSGTSVASGATLRLENNVAVGSEALALSGTLRQASGNNSYAGAISGSGGLVVSGGQLTLSGASANTYSGDTIVSAGTLVLGKSAGVTAVSGNITVGSGSGSANLTLSSSNQIADSSRLTLSPGGTPVFNLANNHETLGSLSSSNPASSVSLGSATLSTGSDNSSSTFAGIISGSGGLSKLGSGTFTLSGSNSYSGNTSVSSGTVALGASNRISDSSALALAGGTLALGGIYSERVGNLSYTDGSVVDLGAVGSANHLLFADDAASAGTLTVRNWTSGSDTFGVATNAVAQSFLDNIFFDGIGVGIGAEIGSLVSVSGYGSFYEIRPIATFSWVGGNSGGSSPVNGWSKGDNWSGGIAPGVGADKALVFGGSVDLANDMNGAYIVRSIRYDSSAGAFVTTSSTGDTLTLRGGGVYNDSAATQTLNVPVALGASQTWTAANGALSLSGATLLLGTNTLTVTGAANTSISAVVSGTGSAALVKNGAGTLALSGANTYSGTTTVSTGTLLASHASALGSTAAGTVVNSGGTLALSGGVTIGAESLSLAGSGAGGLGALRNVSGANSYAGAITLAGDATITSAAGSLSLTGTIAAGGNALAVDGAGDLVIASTISDATALAKSGSGTLAFTADQTFSGEITLGGGTLSLVDADLGVATLRVTAASVLDFSGSSTLTVGQLVLELGAGQTLSVTSWQEVSDFFLVSNFLGATRDTTGQAPMNQIVFATFSGDNTRWKSGAGEVTPVPEPATYGALALGGLAAWSALRRRRRV